MINSNERIIKHKIGLLNLAEELGNVSQACKMMGLSRDTFYRYKEAVDEGGVQALLDKPRRKPNPKNRVDEVTEEAVLKHAIDYPAMVRHEPAMNSENSAPLSHPVGFVVSGYVITWLVSGID